MKAQHFIIIVVSLLYCTSTRAQVPLIPMVEMFTNAGCEACVTQQMHSENIIKPYEKKIIQLEYHYVTDTTADILAEQENNIPKRRKNFYLQKVQETPAMVIGGISWPGKFGSPKDLTASMMDDALAKTSIISLNTTHTINTNRDSVFVSINIANDTKEKFLGKDVVLYIALIEKRIEFDSPIGTNGQKVFRNVIRKMLPNYLGKNIGRNILGGRTLDFNFSTSIPEYLYDLNKMAVVAWVQHNKEKVIFQSSESEPIDFTGTSDLKNHVEINISPNPVVGMLNMTIELQSDQQISISLIDLQGKRIANIWNGNTQYKHILWSTSHLDPGVYIVQIKSVNGIVNRKVMVQD